MHILGNNTKSTYTKQFFSSTCAADYKDKVLPYDECLHDTIKYSSQCINCLTIKPNNMIDINCGLGCFMGFLSKLFSIKNYMMEQMFH